MIKNSATTATPINNNKLLLDPITDASGLITKVLPVLLKVVLRPCIVLPAEVTPAATAFLKIGLFAMAVMPVFKATKIGKGILKCELSVLVCQKVRCKHWRL